MGESFATDFENTFSEAALPPEITSRYDVIECLAHNDHCETYLLTGKESGKKYVLKRYALADIAGGVSEAKLLRGIDHEGLPRFEAEIKTADSLYVLREHLDGITLEQFMSEYRTDEKQIIGIMTRLCDILTYLHNQPEPIIHRDIKPSNIIIEPRGNHPKLIDFSISRVYSEDTDTDTSHLGTRTYAPPEQYGFAQTDQRADIYALGMVFRFMLTGAADGELQNRRLEKIIKKCTAFSPDDRYKSAQALKKDLEKIDSKFRARTLQCVIAAAALYAAFMAGVLVGSFTDFASVFLSPTEQRPEDRIAFTEPLIEKAVRVALDKADGEPISREDLAQVTQLIINGETACKTMDEYYDSFGTYGTISDLDDVRMMANIRRLMLGSQPLTDVSPLADCLMLEAIKLDDCPVSDVSSLAAMPRLKELELFGLNIEDVSCFADFKTLENLSLGSMPLINVSELNAPQIFYLNIMNSSVMSLEEIGLEKFPRLRHLAIAGTQIDDFSLLDDFLNIERIFISSYMEQYLSTMSRADIEVVD